MTWRAEYEPYGAVFGLRSPDQHQPLRFPGQEAEQLGLGANGVTERSYNIYRWYHSGTARYSQPDPLRTRSARLSPYIYALNNPTHFVDQLGLQATALPSSPRDPFSPPFDPAFQSGPWGPRPDVHCCDRNQIAQAIKSVDKQINAMTGGGVPSGIPVGATINEIGCRPDGWCQSLGSGTFDPNISPDLKDPCVRFCVRVHEWYHYTDTRWWNSKWSDDVLVRFWEEPAYYLGRSCLLSF